MLDLLPLTRLLSLVFSVSAVYPSYKLMHHFWSDTKTHFGDRKKLSFVLFFSFLLFFISSILNSVLTFSTVVGYDLQYILPKNIASFVYYSRTLIVNTGYAVAAWGVWLLTKHLNKDRT